MHKRQDPVSSRWCSLCRSKCALCSLIQKAGSQVWCELARGLQRRLEPAGTLSASPLTPSNQCAVFHHSHLHATPQTPVTPPCRLTTRSAQPTSLWVPISRCGARSHVSKRHACAAIRLHGYYDRVVLMVCFLAAAQSVRSKYPQTGWQFLGLQETGLYRNWPAIHQVRYLNILLLNHGFANVNTRVRERETNPTLCAALATTHAVSQRASC